MSSLTARANTGTGTDTLGGETHADGFVSAVVIRDQAGTPLGTAGNPINETNAALGLASNAVATDDTGAWSLIALMKRLLGKLPVLGPAVMAASMPVTIASNQTAISVSETALILTGAAAQSAPINNILESVAGAAWTDVANYRSMSVQIASTGTAGTFIFEMSNDGVNAVVMPHFSAAAVTGAPFTGAITATATNFIYTIPIRTRFIRLRIVSAITGGTIQAFSRLSAEPWTPTVAAVGQSIAANLNATVTGTVTANVAGTGITGGTISPLTVAGASVEASSAKTASGNSAAALTNASGTDAHFFVNVTAVAGTTPTLAVRVQLQDPVSLAFVDLPGAVTASITANGLYLLTVNNLPRAYRLAWTIGGTTPSFTFSVGIAPVI